MYRILITKTGVYACPIFSFDSEIEVLEDCVSSGDVFMYAEDLDEASDLLGCSIELGNE